MIGSGLIMIIRDSARKGKSAYAISKEQHISKNTAIPQPGLGETDLKDFRP
jgi:hypothetical protein